MEVIIGSHVSFKKEDQLLGSIREALSYGANTFMFYTGAPQNTSRSELNEELIQKGLILMKENRIDQNNVIVHAPYIINLANPNNEDFSVSFLKEEMKRVEQLGMNKIVLHPGSHVGLGIEKGIEQITKCLNKVIDRTTKVMILLETMAGKGSEIGSTFEELKQIIDNINYSDKVGVCLDTCHMNDAGYSLENFDQVLEEFDRIIGIDKLKCIHINDSKNERGTHKDRHENIGYGTIGFDALMHVIYHEKVKDIPKILETPYVSCNDGGKDRTYPPYKFEIEMIRTQKKNPHLLEDIRQFYK